MGELDLSNTKEMSLMDFEVIAWDRFLEKVKIGAFLVCTLQIKN